MPLDDLSFVLLVGVPFASGVVNGSFTGNTSRSVIIAAMTILVLIVWVPQIGSLELQFPESSDLGLRLFGMALVWGAMGYNAGFLSRRYIKSVGLHGYLFTISLNLTAVSLSGILFETPLTQFLKGEPIDFQIGLDSYFAVLITGIFVLSFLGNNLFFLGLWGLFKGVLNVIFERAPRSAYLMQGPKTAFKEFIGIISFFGILSFLAAYFVQGRVSDLLWWVPRLAPPNSYQLFFTLAVASIAILPSYDPSDIFAKKVNLSEQTGILIAMNRSDALDAVELLPLQLTIYNYELPKSWEVVKKHQDSKQFVIWARPPGRLSDKLKATRLDLLVFQYPDDTIIDEEKFKASTYVNLKAATIMEDRIGERHGVMSHECLYKQEIGYGYVVRFIKQHHEFVIRWFSFDPEQYRRYLPRVEEFIESFKFDISDTDSSLEQ